MEAHVTAHSQSYRLRQRAEEAQVQHGQELRADLSHIRVTASGAPSSEWPATPEGCGEVFFCNMGPVRVRQVLASGDGGPLPTNVIVEGLEVPGAGFYDLLNVLVRSNGDIRLVVDAETRVVPAAEYAEPAQI